MNPTPMMLIPSPYARIKIESEKGVHAELVTMSPWPGLPAGPTTGEDAEPSTWWRCCDRGAMGTVSQVELHLPSDIGDPAFTVTILLNDETHARHLVEVHGFRPVTR